MHKMASKGTSKRSSSSLPVAAYVKVHQFDEVLLLCEFAVTRVLNAPADRGQGREDGVKMTPLRCVNLHYLSSF